MVTQATKKQRNALRLKVNAELKILPEGTDEKGVFKGINDELEPQVSKQHAQMVPSRWFHGGGVGGGGGCDVRGGSGGSVCVRGVFLFAAVLGGRGVCGCCGGGGGGGCRG